MSVESFYSLAEDTNKRTGSSETAAGEQLPELTLDMPDDDIIAKSKRWQELWNNSEVKSEWEKMSKTAVDYWKGKQFSGVYTDEDRPLQDNVIFEAAETFLPQATKRNPEPVIRVKGLNVPTELQEFAKSIQQEAADWADEVKLRLKLKRVGRLWLLYFIGAAEIGWDLAADRPKVTPLRPKKLILDPDCHIDEDGYHGRFVGIIQKADAGTLIKLYPKCKKYIEEKVDKKLNTNITYVKWLTPEHTFLTWDNKVLDKLKNPLWNWDQQQEQPNYVDEMGNEVPAPPMEVEGRNHFPEPQIPVVFLTVFNLGNQPIDETGLVHQNLPQQDLINKRLRQIDKNADKMNGGQVISGEQTGLTQEEAAVATEAINNGGTIYIPQGNAQSAVGKIEAQALPADVFNQLVDTRTRLLQIFGTQGISSQGVGQEKTVRGKIITKSNDSDRIGGGISEYLEQFSDDVYNWYIQLLYVFRPDVFAQFDGQLLVSVKEGSLLPKDSLSLAQQAIDLGSAGKMALVDMFKALEYPNPEEMAVNVWLEINAPQLLYPDDPRIQQALGMMAQQAAMQQDQQVQQQQMQQDGDMQKQQVQMEGQKEMKQMDNQAKLDQIAAQGQQDIMSQVPIQ